MLHSSCHGRLWATNFTKDVSDSAKLQKKIHWPLDTDRKRTQLCGDHVQWPHSDTHLFSDHVKRPYSVTKRISQNNNQATTFFFYTNMTVTTQSVTPVHSRGIKGGLLRLLVGQAQNTFNASVGCACCPWPGGVLGPLVSEDIYAAARGTPLFLRSRDGGDSSCTGSSSLPSAEGHACRSRRHAKASFVSLFSVACFFFGLHFSGVLVGGYCRSVGLALRFARFCGACRLLSRVSGVGVVCSWVRFHPSGDWREWRWREGGGRGTLSGFVFSFCAQHTHEVLTKHPMVQQVSRWSGIFLMRARASRRIF